MTNDDMPSIITLDHNEWRGVQQLSNALTEYEPLAKRARLGLVVAQRLVEKGLAERARRARDMSALDMRRATG